MILKQTGDREFEHTQTTTYHEDRHYFRMVTKYGFTWLKGNALPYFHITAVIDVQKGWNETYEKAEDGKMMWKKTPRWEDYASGCCHDYIAARMRGLAPLIPFHGYDITGVPTYYMENGLYFYRQYMEGALGLPDPISFFGKKFGKPSPVVSPHQTPEKALEYWREMVLLGPDEPMPKVSVRTWMKHRLFEYIRPEFFKTMGEFGFGEYINTWRETYPDKAKAEIRLPHSRTYANRKPTGMCPVGRCNKAADTVTVLGYSLGAKPETAHFCLEHALEKAGPDAIISPTDGAVFVPRR